MERGVREGARDKMGSFEDLIWPHTVASGKEEAEESQKQGARRTSIHFSKNA